MPLRLEARSAREKRDLAETLRVSRELSQDMNESYKCKRWAASGGLCVGQVQSVCGLCTKHHNEECAAKPAQAAQA